MYLTHSKVGGYVDTRETHEIADVGFAFTHEKSQID